MILLVLACAKAPAVPDLVERDAPVAPAPDVDVLLLGLASPDPDVRAIATGALVRRLPPEGVSGLVVSGLASAHAGVRRAVVDALAHRGDEPWARGALEAITTSPARDLLTRSHAALALGHAGAPVLGVALDLAPRSGAALGLWVAGASAGVPGAREGLDQLLDGGTLPLEPALAWSLAEVPGVLTLARVDRAEAPLQPHLHCALLLAGVPGALAHATRAARAMGDDAVDAWAGCPAPGATRVLRALPGPLPRYARVARGDLPSRAALPVEGDGWPDRVRALARAPGDDAHRALAAFAAGADDAGREVVAVAMVGHARAADEPLRELLRADASLRTRVAAAAWPNTPLVLGGSPGG